MAKTSYNTANVDVSVDTFGSWIDKTNQVFVDMGTTVLTAAAVPQPNTTNGAQVTGNTHVEGIVSANTITAVGGIRGGTVSVPAPLVVQSNVAFTGAQTVSIPSTTTQVDISANTLTVNSNVSFGGLTRSLRVDVANTTINTGSLFLTTNAQRE